MSKPIRIEVTNGNGQPEVVDISKVVLPIRYWFALWGPMILVIVSVVATYYSTVNGFEKKIEDTRISVRAYADTLSAAHKAEEHVYTYRPMGGETLNERLRGFEVELRGLIEAQKDRIQDNKVQIVAVHTRLNGIEASVNRLADTLDKMLDRGM